MFVYRTGGSDKAQKQINNTPHLLVYVWTYNFPNDDWYCLSLFLWNCQIPVQDKKRNTFTNILSLLRPHKDNNVLPNNNNRKHIIFFVLGYYQYELINRTEKTTLMRILRRFYRFCKITIFPTILCYTSTAIEEYCDFSLLYL